MKVDNLIKIIGADFYAGVPDSFLKALTNYLMNTYGMNPSHHIVAANEGNCVALAAGYYLATQKVPVVYMQNSGEGNVINPVASLTNKSVYAIPVIFIIGWRGELNIQDEPQHIYQGRVTVKLLEDMDIKTFVITRETSDVEVASAMDNFSKVLADGKNVAFVICKDALTYEGTVEYGNSNTMMREDVIRHIVKIAGEAPIVSTTGKASRELYEVRKEYGESHKYDFLTVGSMGHSSSIALGVAINKVNTKVWCIDGDGAVLMHMGALAVIGTIAPRNMIHIIINNEAHESVGGVPTVANKIDLVSIAKACGYPNAVCVDNFEDLDRELDRVKRNNELSMIEVKCSIGARDDLGRPEITTLENKQIFMEHLNMI